VAAEWLRRLVNKAQVAELLINTSSKDFALWL
jgi:hypothetical protein